MADEKNEQGGGGEEAKPLDQTEAPVSQVQEGLDQTKAEIREFLGAQDATDTKRGDDG